MIKSKKSLVFEWFVDGMELTIMVSLVFVGAQTILALL